MTVPSPRNQEPPLRKPTAEVYRRHALLFLGWYYNFHLQSTTLESLKSIKLQDLFPENSRDGAQHAYTFMQWLKDSRKISISYEANMLRGLIKLAKFIYHKESSSDSNIGH